MAVTTTLIVDSGYPGPSDGIHFTTIQAAVDAVTLPDTVIEIEAGTYVEQVDINGKSNLTLRGVGEVKVDAPADVVPTAISSTGRSINAVITVENGANVILENLNVDGNGAGNSVDGSNANFVGVFYRSASGGLTNVDITGVHDAYPGGTTSDGFDVQSGNQRGVGLQVDNTGPQLAFFMHGGSISDFQKNATVFNNAILDVTGVTVQGGGAQTIIAQNGFQALNSTGSISGNTITGIGYAGAQVTVGCAIITYQTSDLAITDNTITAPTDPAAQSAGIYLAEFGGNTVGGTVTGNTITHAQYAVAVESHFNGGTFTVGDNTVTDTLEALYYGPEAGSTVSLHQIGTDAPDVIVAETSSDFIDGGLSSDTLDMTVADAGGAFVDLASGIAFSTATGQIALASIENVQGSVGGDALYGDGGDNTFIATTGADIVDGRGGSDTFDASSAGASVNVNLTTGAVSGAFTATLTSIENVKTGSGADTVTLSNAANAVDAGGGTDTAVAGMAYAGSPAIGWDNSAQAFTFGSDTLKGVEKLTFDGGTTVWLVHNATELADALLGSADGDVIKLAKNTYTGTFTVSHAVTIESATGVASDAIIKGNFRSLNGLGANDSVADFLKTHSEGSVPATGNGLTISHGGVTLKNITVSEFNVGVALSADVDGVTIDGVDFTSNLNAMRKSEQADVTHFTWSGGTVKDGWAGLTAYADTSGGGNGSLDQVVIDGVSFEDLTYKGLYFEQLSNAEIKNIDMDNVGQWGAWNTGKFGAGIDINLKYEAYSNIDIHDFEFNNVGSSLWGDASADTTGAAIVVKARSDSGYAAHPATLNNVQIHDGSIDGTSTGIRFGEPGANNVGPGTVTVSNVDITGALLGSYDNQSLTSRVIQLTADADTVTTTSGSVSPIAYQGGDGDDNITGSNASEGFDGGAGNDSIDGGGGTDTAVYSETLNAGAIATNGSGGWTITQGNGDHDTLANVEVVDDAASGHFLLVGAGGFATIQAAVNAASAGDTILVASGTFAEDLIVSKSVTILGAQHGVEGTDGDRNPVTGVAETTIVGHVKITAPGAVVMDGLRFLNTSATTGGGSSNPALQVLSGYDHIITNSVFYSTVAGGANNVDDRAISLSPLASGEITVSNNLFTGSSAGAYGTASWGRGIWLDGGGAEIHITGNTIEYSRTAINADMGGTSVVEISGNTIHTAGSGISVGVDNDGLTIEGNTFENVGDDFNLRNLNGDVTFDASQAIDSLVPSGSAAQDVVNVLGGGGNDSLSGTEGADFLDGNNLSSVHLDNDTLYGRGGADVVLGRAGNDALHGDAGNDSIDGGDGNDTVDGGADNDSILGGAGNDSIDGGASNDTIDAGADNDTITGGDGDDSIDGGSGVDTVVFEHALNEYTIQQSGGTYAITRNGTVDTVKGVEFFKFGTQTIDVQLDADAVINKFNPVFSPLGAEAVSVAENSANVVVYDANATEADSAAIFGNIVYSLEGSDAGAFSINTANGEVTLTAAADHEIKTSYALTVRATQGVTTSTKALTVNVTDLNDNPVVFAATAAASVQENSSVAQVIYDANATDADTGTMVYSLSGTDATAFNIDAATGELRLKVASDFETKASYALNIVATQGASTASQALTVTVTNVDEGVILPSGTKTVESGTTKAPLGTLASNAALTFDVTALNKGGGHIYLGGTELAVGQTGLTLEQINSLTFSSKNDGSIQFLSHDGGNTGPLNVILDVTKAVSKTYTGSNSANYIDGAGGNDKILGKNGNDTLVGSSGKDSIDGGSGDDWIFGGKSHDTLVGGSGEDKFVFDIKLSASNADVIKDFVHGTDALVLESDFFGALGSSVSSGEFRKNTTGNAQDSNDKLVYETDTGKLYYDADGNGSGAKVLVVTLDPHISNLSYHDFQII